VGVVCGTSSVGLQLEEFTTCAANQSSQTFEVINTGATALNLNLITIKFWVDDTNFSSNGANTITGALNFGGGFGTTNAAVNGVAINAVNFSPACGPDSTHQANWELTISDTDTRTLSAGTTWSSLQTALHVGSSFVNFVPGDADWYSPCGIGGGSTYTNDLHYAVYYQGNLVTASGGAPPTCRPNPTCTPSPTPPGGLARLTTERGEGTSTPTISPTTDYSLLQSVVAAPNVSRNGESIKFLIELGKSARVNLSLFNLAGEKIYGTQTEGNAGLNDLVWNIENQGGQAVANGLYLYVLQVGDGNSLTTKVGKLAVLR
jgi:hypothetical protein